MNGTGTVDLMIGTGTFDLQIDAEGINYQVGDRILILGSQAGGETPRNDILLTVNNVDESGRITGIFCQGTAPLLSDGETFSEIFVSNIISGTGALFRVRRVSLGYFVNIENGGAGYRNDNRILILGSRLGGVDGVNDCILTVTNAGTFGEILEVSVQGTGSPGVRTYSGVPGNKIYGSGAAFDFIVASGEKTIFDGGSLRFVAPVDNYTTTDEFDKYLVFPKRTILT
jgi:hypothetical protein